MKKIILFYMSFVVYVFAACGDCPVGTQRVLINTEVITYGSEDGTVTGSVRIWHASWDVDEYWSNWLANHNGTTTHCNWSPIIITTTERTGSELYRIENIYGTNSTSIWYTNYDVQTKNYYECIPCDTLDKEFPAKDGNYSYSEKWQVDASDALQKSQACDEVNGTIESEKINCMEFERCKIPNNDNNCTLPDTNYNIPDNVISLFSWIESEDRSQECNTINNTEKLTRRVNCKTEYLCALITDEPPKICDEEISSYVSPSDSTFHEDITITGTEFGLHYNSGNVDENQSQTIAYGWSFSNHATFDNETNRLYLGSGSLWVVEPYEEDGDTVVKSGSSELLFDEEGRHISTRDLYTKEVESTFTYDSNDLLISVTNQYNETTTINRDTDGIITNIESPHGQVTYLAIDENYDLIEVQYEDTTSYTFEYEDHLMTVETEPNGNAFLHFFDEQGKVVKVIDAEQGEWDFGVTTDTTSGTTTVTKASGDTITYTNHFLENGLLKTEKTLPTGDTILYAHSVDDSLSETTTCGETSTRTYKLENGTLAKDPLHDRRILERTTQTTPNGLTQTTNYSTNYSFDAEDTLISIETVTNTNGATTTSIRDYNQSTQTITSPEGIITQNTFDPVTQNILSTQYANFEPTTFNYDEKGRVTQTTQGER